MNKTLVLLLIFVSSCALCSSHFRSSTIATPVQSTSVDQQHPVPPASCPVTVPPTTPFTPPGEREMDAKDNDFWLGTEKLWIALPKAGEVWGSFVRYCFLTSATSPRFEMSVTYRLSFTRSASEAPLASRIVFRFSNTCRVWSVTSPSPTRL